LKSIKEPLLLRGKPHVITITVKFGLNGIRREIRGCALPAASTKRNIHTAHSVSGNKKLMGGVAASDTRLATDIADYVSGNSDAILWDR
jgi:hypothetical protein